MKIFNSTQIICNNAFEANTFVKRMIGLLGKKSFGNMDGLLLCPCSQIHSIGMKFSFDAVYLDKNFRIVALYENVGKNRILPYNVAVKSVLELPSGTISSCKIGINDVLEISKE